MFKKYTIIFFLSFVLLVSPAVAVAPLAWALGVSVVAHTGLLLMNWYDTMQSPASAQLNVTLVTAEEEAAIGAEVGGSTGPYCVYSYQVASQCTAMTHLALGEAWLANQTSLPGGLYVNTTSLVRTGTSSGNDYDLIGINLNDIDDMHYQYREIYAWQPNGGALLACPVGMVETMSDGCQLEESDGVVDLYVDQNGDIRTDLDPDNASILPDGMVQNAGLVEFSLDSIDGFTDAKLEYDSASGEFRVVTENSSVPIKVGDVFNGDYATVKVAEQYDASGTLTGEATVLTYDDSSTPQEGDQVGSVTLTAGAGNGSSGSGSLTQWANDNGGGGGDNGDGDVTCWDGSTAGDYSQCPPQDGTGNCGGPNQAACSVDVINDVGIDETGTPTTHNGFGTQETGLGSITPQTLGVADFSVDSASWFNLSLGSTGTCTDPIVHLGGIDFPITVCTYWLPFRAWVEYMIYIATFWWCYQRSTRVLAGG